MPGKLIGVRLLEQEKEFRLPLISLVLIFGMKPVGANSFKNELWHNARRWSFRCFRPAKFSDLQKKRGPFDAHRCIFVHIPKCAGISVVQSLFGDFDCGHTGLKRYQIMFAPGEFKNYFKFTVVRNPYDRLVSAFLFMKKGGINEKDRRWAERNLSPYADFDAFVKGWVNRKNIRSGLHFRPQCGFICLEKNRPALDFIGYYENLAADFALICRKLQKGATLLEANRNLSRARNYQEYYTAESRKIVAEAYADDLQVLGYAFDNSNLEKQLARRALPPA
jgi:hypothetical protein